MKVPSTFRFAILLIPCIAAYASLWAQVNVTTYKNDNSRTGLYPNELKLNPATVSGGHFGKLFSTPVDGQVYAQPLYVYRVANITGGTHNVLYVVTEHDSLYAIDADSGSILWQHPDPNNHTGGEPLVPVQFTEVGNVSNGGCSDLKPEIGITGTPVIDLNSGTIFYVTKSKEISIVQMLHAVDMATGAEKLGGPVLVGASVKGSGNGSASGLIRFNAQTQLNRPGLLLYKGHVVTAWGGHCDVDPYHGWVISYNASTLKQEGVFISSPNGYKAGIWMSGDGLAADGDDNLYLATGNGLYDGSLSSDFGDTIIKLKIDVAGSLSVIDWFTPGNQKNLDKHDLDLGSGGVLLLPNLPSGIARPHLLVQMGKDETIRVIDRDSMGKFCGSDDCANNQIPQELSNNPSAGGIWGAPAYWHGTVYWAGGLGSRQGKGLGRQWQWGRAAFRLPNSVKHSFIPRLFVRSNYLVGRRYEREPLDIG